MNAPTISRACRVVLFGMRAFHSSPLKNRVRLVVTSIAVVHNPRPIYLE